MLITQLRFKVKITLPNLVVNEYALYVLLGGQITLQIQSVRKAYNIKSRLS